MALAHAVGTDVERAYQRSDMFEKRRALMQAWADYCAGRWDMKKKSRKTKLPRWVEKVVRIHVPASLPPEFFNAFTAAIARAHACGEITAEATKACFREFELQAEEYHMMMDRFVEEKFVALLDALRHTGRRPRRRLALCGRGLAVRRCAGA